jgi:hypothetical protein
LSPKLVFFSPVSTIIIYQLADDKDGDIAAVAEDDNKAMAQ